MVLSNKWDFSTGSCYLVVKASGTFFWKRYILSNYNFKTSQFINSNARSYISPNSWQEKP